MRLETVPEALARGVEIKRCKPGEFGFSMDQENEARRASRGLRRNNDASIKARRRNTFQVLRERARMMPPASLAGKCMALRAEWELSQDEMARRCGVKPFAIRYLETGREIHKDTAGQIRRYVENRGRT